MSVRILLLEMHAIKNGVSLNLTNSNQLIILSDQIREGKLRDQLTDTEYK